MDLVRGIGVDDCSSLSGSLVSVVSLSSSSSSSSSSSTSSSQESATGRWGFDVADFFFFEDEDVDWRF